MKIENKSPSNATVEIIENDSKKFKIAFTKGLKTWGNADSRVLPSGVCYPEDEQAQNSSVMLQLGFCRGKAYAVIQREENARNSGLCMEPRERVEKPLDSIYNLRLKMVVRSRHI